MPGPVTPLCVELEVELSVDWAVYLPLSDGIWAETVVDSAEATGHETLSLFPSNFQGASISHLGSTCPRQPPPSLCGLRVRHRGNHLPLLQGGGSLKVTCHSHLSTAPGSPASMVK